MITDERAQKAIDFLAATDKRHAEARSLVSRLQELRKSIKGMLVSQYMGSGMAHNKATEKAYDADEYREHLKELDDAELAFFTLDNQRKTASALIDMWRTYQANIRKGNI